MKISLYIIRTLSVCQNASKNLSSSSASTQLHPIISSSLIAEKRDKIPSKRAPKFPTRNEPDFSLYRRISPVGDPDISIVPVLDQWVREGRQVDKETLIRIIKSLRSYKRYKHALEISEWMTEKRYMPPSKDDILTRLQLIYKVHGLEKAEEYYNNVSCVLKGYEVDLALMKCYSQENSVEKAEAIMQKLRDSGCRTTGMPYSILMNLYHSVGSWEKIETLAKEMEEKGIYGDKYSFTPRLNAYAATSNVEGLNRTMAIMKSDPRVGMDCYTYIVAAQAFFKAGLEDKVLEMLKKIEKMVSPSNTMHKTLNFLLRMYATLGKKDEVYRIWKHFFGKKEIYNKNYRSMICSLLILDDIEGAEKIFKEWESNCSSYDFRIPDGFIDVYIRKGQLEKAEVLLNHGIEKGGNPTFKTWYFLTCGYMEDNQVLKGIEALKNAAFSCRCDPYQEHVRDRLAICLEFLEKQRNVDEADEFLNSVKVEGIFSSTVCERLLGFIKGEDSKS